MLKKLLLNKIRIILFILSIIVNGCKNQKEESESLPATNNQEAQADTANQGYIFVIPTPLQISSTIKLLGLDYNEQFLLPVNKSSMANSNNMENGLLLGATIVDLGYSTVFEQGQTSLNYLKNIKLLMEELNITSTVNEKTVKRFEKNMRVNDSLYTIIMDCYNSVQQYFIKNKREEESAYIMTGAYIEGLYILLKHNQIMPSQKMNELIIQQKNYLDNLISIIEFHEPNDNLIKLYGELMTLKKSFEIVSDHPDTIANKKINIEINNKILKATEELRKTLFIIKMNEE